MAKQLMFDHEAHRKVLAGIRKLTGAVKVTLGPSGRNVILGKKAGKSQATKDGVTVSKEVELDDAFENIGAKLVNSAADKTNDDAGDGTSTAVVLAEAIFEEGLRNLTAGCDPARLKRGIDKAVAAAAARIGKISRPVEGKKDYRHVALVSSHFDEPVAGLVADAMEKVGEEGVITVEEGKGFATEMEFVDGMDVDKGYISPYFINKPDSLTAEYEDVYILLTDGKISAVQELIPVLEQVARSGRPLMIVAEEVEGEALAALVVNRLRGVLQTVAVKAPAFGDRRKAVLQDLAILTGGEVVSEEMGTKLENMEIRQLGRAKRVRVEKERTTIVGGGGSKKAIDNRVQELRTSIEKSDSDYDREKLQERLAKLLGGVAILRVGGATETEMKERKYRVEDAVNAVRAAAQEGVVPGGGVVFIRAIDAIGDLDLEGDERIGGRIVAKALESPLKNIARNTGADPSGVLYEVKKKKGAYGFNAATGEFKDLVKEGILDPAKVSRLALQNAASVASMLLTSNTVIAELEDKKKAVAGAVK
ncbi:MAG: chaperonin GroEL [Planctomycetota bacterium]|jgi:chaperonin GroEL